MVEPFIHFLTTLSSLFELSSFNAESRAFLLDDKILIEWDDKIVPNTILISAPVGSLESKDEAFFLKCLEENSQQPFTLSIKEETLFLHQRICPDISKNDLEAVLNHFRKSIDDWRQIIENRISAPDLLKGAQKV